MIVCLRADRRGSAADGCGKWFAKREVGLENDQPRGGGVGGAADVANKRRAPQGMSAEVSEQEDTAVAAILNKPAQAAGQVQSVALLWLWQVSRTVSAQAPASGAASHTTVWPSTCMVAGKAVGPGVGVSIERNAVCPVPCSCADTADTKVSVSSAKAARNRRNIPTLRLSEDAPTIDRGPTVVNCGRMRRPVSACGRRLQRDQRGDLRRHARA